MVEHPLQHCSWHLSKITFILINMPFRTLTIVLALVYSIECKQRSSSWGLRFISTHLKHTTSCVMLDASEPFSAIIVKNSAVWISSAISLNILNTIIWWTSFSVSLEVYLRSFRLSWLTDLKKLSPWKNRGFGGENAKLQKCKI